MEAHAYNILIERWARPNIRELAATFAAAGMHVERVGERLGIVSGRIPQEAVAKIEAMPEVKVVAPDSEVALPTPVK
jgi:hypothetical protein